MRDDWLDEEEYKQMLQELYRRKYEGALTPEDIHLELLDKHYEEVLAEIVRKHE